ncbi:unnamed protein product [Litomosoides sigmodontis]|uniref:Uncharacterized protein n=1 Tax=Litomosoides sigmodontis TaxID=42156 RepID=A0A3P6UCM8_LITSI|nr:unnamed protein product [Litomosoides sigmodontis]
MSSGNITKDSDVERNFIYEANDRDSRDATIDSLTGEAKSLLNIHQPTQVDVFQREQTPVDCRNSVLTPSTIKHTRNVPSDATPVAAAFSEGMLSMPHRRTYLNIAEIKEENKQLKAEVFDLKSQLFVLKRSLPSIVNNEGRDFTEEYLKMQTELDNEKVLRVEMEQKWYSEKKKSDEERAKFESERKDWEKNRERLLMDKDELAAELKGFHQQLSERYGERDDGNESQGDSSLSTISLISERGMEIEKLRSVVLQQSVDEKKLRLKMEHDIIQLQDQLKLAQDDLAKQTAHYTKEKTLCETLKAEIANLQETANRAKQEVEYQKQIFEEELAKAHATNEVALNKRDRTIRILLKKLKSGDAETSSSLKERNNSCSLHRDVANLNPYAQGILDQINEFTAENDAIRKKVIEWGTVNIDLTSEIESNETPSAEDESSEWNTKRCERENEKLAAFLAQNKTVPDDLNEEELGGKLALFDAVNGSGEGYLNEELNNTARSVGASEMLNITSAADLLGKSLVLTEDLGEAKKMLSVLQSACTRLFEKLRGSANFLQTLLDELGAGDRGRDVIAEIQALCIDLDQSVAVAINASRNVEAAEESMGELSAHLQRSLLNCSFGISSVPSSENQQNASALSRVHKAYRQLNTDLANEKMRANEAVELNEKLKAHVGDLEESKQKLIDELHELKKKLAEKEDETISSKTQLQCKNQQCGELNEKVQQLQQKVKTKETLIAEKEAEMKQLIDQMTKRCRELEIQIAENDHVLRMKDESIKKLVTDIQNYSDQLLSSNSELAHYRKEITELDNKMCGLINTVKETLGIVEDPIDKPTVESTSADIAALAQLSQIGADLEEFTKISHYIADLRNQVVKLQQNLDLCEESRNALNLKCRGLSDQNAHLEAKYNETKQKLLTLQHQIQVEKESVKVMEKDLQHLKSENSCVKENNERLTNMLMNIEAKYEELSSKLNRSSLSDKQYSERYTMTIGTMTAVSSHDFMELTNKVKKVSSFTKRMYALAAQWDDEIAVTRGVSSKSIDLDDLYHTYARILKGFSDGVNEMRDKIISEEAKLKLYVSENQNLHQIRTESSRSNQDELENSYSTGLNVSQNEPVSVDLRTLCNDANQIVQKLKAVANGSNKTEVLEVLSNMRSLRFQIDSLRRYSQHIEKTKEDVAPVNYDFEEESRPFSVEALQLENERLQSMLTDAKILLQRAHERLSKLPNSTDMCEQILREMNEISKAMKATTREVHRIGRRNKCKKP